MREFNLFSDLPESKEPRVVHPNIRTIKNRLIASERGKEFYDGDRNNGYGGYEYDGRWKPVAQKIMDEYSLSENASILHIGSDKGFLLADLLHSHPYLLLRGYETSSYARINTIDSVYQMIIGDDSLINLPWTSKIFDFVIASGIYSLNLPDIVECLKEIQRVGKGQSHITLGAFETEEEERLFRQWTLLGTTILSKSDWLEVLNYAGYTGDYWFSTAKTLNLIAPTFSETNPDDWNIEIPRSMRLNE